MLSFLLKPFLFLFYSKKNNEVTERLDRDIEEIEKECLVEKIKIRRKARKARRIVTNEKKQKKNRKRKREHIWKNENKKNTNTI